MTARARKQLEANARFLTVRLKLEEEDLATMLKSIESLKRRLKWCREKLETK